MWLKAHRGVFLNECADSSTTKRLVNERVDPGRTQRLVPAAEDSDRIAYSLQDGEKNLNQNWECRHRVPPGTYVCKEVKKVTRPSVGIMPPKTGINFGGFVDAVL
jgi:hypothetical protein